ncbi:MAG: FAD-dependent monooxygenase [Actinomycetales bacterium]|nr:FAD-dependent monooxygenase [Actinomycetales bacterium]
MTNALVVGGGIGGLTTALALAQEGHRVTVVEQAPRFEAVGSGIVLAPNAVHVLRRLGVDLTGIGRVIDRSEVRPATGRAWFVADLAGSDGPTVGVPRPALHAALAEALPASVEIVHGRRVEAVEPVASADGTGARVAARWGETVRHVDVVIGADGLRSAVREIVVGPRRLRYSGTTCWRGFTPWSGGATAVEAWGTGTRVGVVPTGGGSAYYYLVRTAPQGEPGPTEVSTIRRWFAGYEGVAGRVIEALEALPPLHHDLIELDRPVWGSGRVLLLGDAAHAMTPNQGQGAAMAIEDALAVALALRGGVDGALERYARMRSRRVRRVQLSSRLIGRVAHTGGPRVARMRDAVLGLAPATSGGRAVRRLVAPGIALAARSAPAE